MQTILQLCLLSAVYQTLVNGHTYHLGDQCSPVEPMENFDMEKFVGRWYALEKSSTASRCVAYNISETDLKREFKIIEISENPIVGIVKNNIYRSVGKLRVEPGAKPSEMTVKYPLSIAGEATFVVFATDYVSYAGVYSCQNLEIGHRQSAMILSRTPTLEKMVSDKIRNKLSSFKVNPFDLSIINHHNCDYNTNFSLEINENTFTADNLKNGVKKIASSAKDGFNFLVENVKKAYNSVKTEVEKQQARRRDREEVNPHNEPFNPDAEFI